MTSGVLVAGSYVLYKDTTRFRHMEMAYQKGRILAPLKENNFEVTYFVRPTLKEKVSEVLSSKFTNEYYIIEGEAGSGKTRTVVEVVRDMITENRYNQKGAPIYVLSVQGKSFPEALAKAVNFYFDEHVKFRFLLEFLMGIHSFPSRDENSRLVRVLAAIEESAFNYMIKAGQPIVLVLDGIDNLLNDAPGALEKLQDKAKLWADSNIAKVVLICNDEDTVSVLQKNSSSWSRAATPIVFNDMRRQDAIEFLRVPNFMEYSEEKKIMPVEEAERIVDLVGGHIHHLIICKRNWFSGKSYQYTERDLRMREREKFVNVSQKPALWIAISKIRNSPKKSMLLSKLVNETSEDIVCSLAKKNIIRYRRKRLGTTVHFQTRLTENVVDEFQRVYDKRSLVMPRSVKDRPQSEKAPMKMNSIAEAENENPEN